MKLPNNSNYMLSMVNHKGTYQLTEDIELKISKDYENNLRERNPQLGRVEAVPEDNPYNLQVGDIVAVNHFTFYGDIGKDRAFNLQEHVEIEGVKLFRVALRQIYFKYNDQIPEPCEDFILCRQIEEETTASGIHLISKPEKNRAIVTHGDWKDKEVLLLDNALYLVTLDRVDYYKVRKDEVVAFIENGDAIPINKNIVVEYVPEKGHPLFDLSLMKKPNNLMAKVIKKCVSFKWNEDCQMTVEGLDYPKDGEYAQVYRNQGVEYNGYRVISGDTILYKYE